MHTCRAVERGEEYQQLPESCCSDEQHIAAKEKELQLY